MNNRPLRILVGVLVLAVGVIALLGAFGVLNVDLGDLISTWWPMVLVVLGIVVLIGNPRGWAAGLVLIAIGAVFQLDQLDIWNVSFWAVLWPVVLVVIGIGILSRALISTSAQGSTVNTFAFWWGADRKVISADFRGGSATALMGGITLDLRGATIPYGGRAIVTTTAVMGGIDIKVPPTWNVVMSGLNLFGGWDDKVGASNPEGAPVLEVRYLTIFGGGDVKL